MNDQCVEERLTALESTVTEIQRAVGVSDPNVELKKLTKRFKALTLLMGIAFYHRDMLAESTSGFQGFSDGGAVAHLQQASGIKIRDLKDEGREYVRKKLRASQKRFDKKMSAAKSAAGGES